ncbi:hypothetical protein M2427_002980 [Bradyrhizobium sp. BR13661]|jgi:hypothetical protein|nr:hypothetical protein [Bradyrhizobium sp. BR13661]
MDPGQYVMGFLLLAIWYGYVYWPFVLLAVVVCFILVVLIGAPRKSRTN